MMSEPGDPFVTFDAAYVLGILDLPDRRAFELHLQTCDVCVSAVASLRDLPGRLAAYRPPELADEPDYDRPSPALPRLLDIVSRQRRRRRTAVGAAVVALAACVIAIVLLATGSSPPARVPGPPIAMTALTATPVHASAVVHSVKWGTQIELRCTYDAGQYPPGVSYGLVVIDRSDVSHPLGDWQLVPGRDTNFAAGTSLSQAQIAAVQVTTAAGVPVLQLTL